MVFATGNSATPPPSCCSTCVRTYGDLFSMGSNKKNIKKTNCNLYESLKINWAQKVHLVFGGFKPPNFSMEKKIIITHIIFYFVSVLEILRISLSNTKKLFLNHLVRKICGYFNYLNFLLFQGNYCMWLLGFQMTILIHKFVKTLFYLVFLVQKFYSVTPHPKQKIKRPRYHHSNHVELLLTAEIKICY